MIPGNDNNGGQERRTLWIVLLLTLVVTPVTLKGRPLMKGTMSPE